MFGLMNNDIYLIGEVGLEINLKSVVDAVNASDKSKPLNIHIHSQGGSVYDGLAIYNYLKGIDQVINTYAVGLVASISTIFFLVGKQRIVRNSNDVLIHLPMGKAQGNAEDLEKTAKELRRIENKLSDIYVSETSLTKEEAINFMKNDEMLSTDLLLEKGIITEVEQFKAVAKFNIKNKNIINMEVLTKKEAKNLFKDFVKKHFGKDELTNKIVQDANGVEIDFTDVAEDATPQVDDTAQVDGANAEGDYVMPSGETFKFTDGVLTEIVEAEGDGDDADMEALKAENADLKEQLEAQATLVAKKETKIKAIKSDMKELKNQVVSGFEYSGKGKKETKAPNAEGTRSIH